MAEREMLKFERDLGADKACMLTKFGGAQSRDQQFQRPKIGKKWTIFVRYISVTTDIDEKNFVFLNTLLTFFLMVVFIYPTLDKIFSLFFLFFPFFFLLLLSTFKPQNADQWWAVTSNNCK